MYLIACTVNAWVNELYQRYQVVFTLRFANKQLVLQQAGTVVGQHQLSGSQQSLSLCKRALIKEELPVYTAHSFNGDCSSRGTMRCSAEVARRFTVPSERARNHYRISRLRQFPPNPSTGRRLGLVGLERKQMSLQDRTTLQTGEYPHWEPDSNAYETLSTW